MAFDLQTIQADARYIALGNSTDTSYGATDLNRNINRWYWRCIGWAIKVNGDWQVKGAVATTDIVISQRDYSLPTNIIRLNEVYIKYQTSGEYYKAKQRDPKMIVPEPDQATCGYFPTLPEFDIFDNYIKIYTPDSTIAAVTAGLKIHFQKELTELSGNTDEPDLPEIVRRIISTGAALDYCIANGIYNKAKKLENSIFGDPTVKNDNGMKAELEEHYANRSTNNPAILTPEEENLY